jgi:hypothetical protein
MSETIAFLLPVLVMAFALWIFLRARRPKKPNPKKVDIGTRQDRAVWAWATILSVNKGAVNTFHMSRVEMELEVHLPGSPAYQAKTTWQVEQDSLDSLEPGKELSLKVDPIDPKYIFPNGNWAKLAE